MVLHVFANACGFRLCIAYRGSYLERWQTINRADLNRGSELQKGGNGKTQNSFNYNVAW